MEPELTAEQHLRAWAKAAASRHKDIAKAVAEVVGLLDANPSVCDELKEGMAKTAVQEQIYSARHAQRTTLKGTERIGAVLAARNAGLQRAFLKTWKVGNKTLAECTKADVDAEAETEHSLACGHEENEQFYRKLSAKMRKPEDVVGKCISSAAAAEMWRGVRQGVREGAA